MQILRKRMLSKHAEPSPDAPQENRARLGDVVESRNKPKRNWLRISIFGNLLLIVIGLASFAGMYTLNLTNTSPEFCANCHVMEKNVKSYLTSSNMDNAHKQANVGCKDCHDYPIPDEIASAVKYVTGDYDQELRQRKFPDAMCTKCHISMTYVAQQTDYLRRNPHLSHWPNLRCGVCHISHGEQVDYCSKCHDNGGQRMVGSPIIPRAENPWADPNREKPNVSLP